MAGYRGRSVVSRVAQSDGTAGICEKGWDINSYQERHLGQSARMKVEKKSRKRREREGDKNSRREKLEGPIARDRGQTWEDLGC